MLAYHVLNVDQAGIRACEHRMGRHDNVRFIRDRFGDAFDVHHRGDVDSTVTYEDADTRLLIGYSMLVGIDFFGNQGISCRSE